MKPGEAEEREAVASLNANALVSLMQEKGLTLPPKDFTKWRPTQRSIGVIPGFDKDLRILCTDGCVAWFEDPSGDLFFGHLQKWSGEAKPLYSIHKNKSEGRPEGTDNKSKRKKKKSAVEAALELLQ